MRAEWVENFKKLDSKDKLQIIRKINGGQLIELNYHDRQLRAGQNANICQNMGVKESLSFAKDEGIENITGSNDKAKYKRLINPRWWLRQIMVISTRAEENLAAYNGLIKKHLTKYAMHNQGKKDERSRSMLSHTFVLQENRKPISMLEIAEKALISRFSRYLNNTDGMTAYADELGHIAAMITLTCPSKMHPMRTVKLRDGRVFMRKNKKYDGTSVRSAQRWLSEIWIIARRVINKAGIFPYGLRVVEPHKSGSPHWHLLLFGTFKELEYIHKIIRGIALKTDGREAGAKDKRCQIEYIDKAKPSTYLFKYILKNIGFDPTKIKDRKDINDKLSDIKAWARLHGIRQMQMIGGVSVKIWQMMRSIEYNIDHVVLEKMRVAAREGDYALFFKLQGGHKIGKKEHYVQAINKVIKKNRYGEEIKATKGLITADGYDLYITKAKTIVTSNSIEIMRAYQDHARNSKKDDEFGFDEMSIDFSFDDVDLGFNDDFQSNSYDYDFIFDDYSFDFSFDSFEYSFDDFDF